MTAEVIEGEVVERSVVVAPQAHVLSGIGAIASLDDASFERNLAFIKKGVERARLMQQALLVEGDDFGAVKGVKRPFLHKPGAEKFEKAYGLATRYTIERMTGDGVTAPPLSFLAHSFVHLGDFAGPVVAEGVGEANSWETKYRYRQGERLCPACGEPAIRRGQKRDKSGDEWYCFRKANGCGTTFAIDNPAIVEQEAGKIDNPDPWDLANTLVKMAKKRAYVDGILQATGTSGLFTQDEDAPIPGAGGPPPPAEPVLRPETDGLIGFAEVGKNDADFQMRMTPTGHILVFRLSEKLGGSKGWKVYARDVLAELVTEHRPTIEKQRVTCWGTFSPESFQKAGQTITYQVLNLTRLKAGDLDLSAPEPDDPDADFDGGWIDPSAAA